MRLDPAHFGQAVGNQAPRAPFEIDRDSPQARGLEAWWPMAPARGATIFDLSGKGRHLPFSGPAWATTAFGNWALDFNGSSHRIDGAPPVIAEPLTISCWFKADDITSSGTLVWIGDKDVINKWWTVQARGGTSGDPLYARSNINSHADTTKGYSAGTWHLAVAVFAASNDRRVYLDGANKGTNTASESVTGVDRISLGVMGDSSPSNFFNGQIFDVRIYNRALSDAEVWGLYDPATRWDLYRGLRVPWAWPDVAGGATTRTAIGSLQAVLRRQASLLASTDAALRAEAAVSAQSGAALAQIVSGSASLGLAVQAVRQAQAELDTALTRALGRDAGLDANLTVQGAFQRASGLDSAIRRLNLLSGALEAALRASIQDTAALDAWLALRLAGIAGLDAATMRRNRLSDTALQGALRATPDRAAALDAVIGALVAAAGSRTLKVATRGRHAVVGGRRRIAIPSGNRRH